MAISDFINVDKIISQLNVAEDSTVADFGSGHGFFSVAFAKKVGHSGQVFAIDVLPQAIEAVRSRARLEGLLNIKTINANLEKPNGSTLPNESCDFVFIANVLFQVSDKAVLINEARRVLKPGGRLAVVEWKAFIGLGPQKQLRIPEEELKQIILSKGFEGPKNIDAGSHHYGFVSIKNKN